MIVLPPVSTLAQVAGAVAVVALSALAFAAFDTLRERLRVAKALASMPGPKGKFLLGIIPLFEQNIHRLHDFQVDMMHQYGGRISIPWNIFTNNMIYLADAADVEHVLSKNVNNWIKSDLFVASVAEVFGKSLLGLNHAHTPDDGAMCHLQRKLMVKVFTTTNFRSFTEGIFQQYALGLVDRIATHHNGKCNMKDIASQYTLQTTFDIVCGVPLASLDAALGLSFVHSMDYVFENLVMRQLIQPYFQYLGWAMPSEYRLARHISVMTHLVDSILVKRLQETPEEIAARSDVLSLFINRAREAMDVDGTTVLDISTLRSVVASLIFAGRDTTTSLIVYAFYALAQYPDEQLRILEEVESVGSHALTFDDVKQLKYLDAFVWETLRLYPAVPSNIKQAAKDDVLPDGTFIPAGTNIMYTPYYMGRNNAALWGDDQLAFRPDRWLTTMSRRPTAYEFPVFQGGPRICPGQNLALLEAKLFIVAILRAYHVAMQEGERLQDRPYVFGPTLIMVDGLPLQLTPRVAAAAAARAH